ncbi:MAG: acyl-CoA dehydrogenase [Rickettsiales bacterium]|nr:acyl-CoA dehydrogenase [Pseudomonadota bacterium]MDA0965509.1 acyl-CoA dehydrogenase [Pseudomonadota bacterium]MDG4542833.1 acyl-CoA dehydrogenase [Rickettsiales bacterium]MDG4544719.1 acyl-CoA dehydrogenase [Rickettsiales bacterium]MDG4546841.1 acyl-CoA dehydrogenase [Rickettsiales bacterium]
MQNYNAPLDDINFLLNDVLKLEDVLRLDKYKDLSGSLINAVLDEASKFAGKRLSPLNVIGDKQGAHSKDSVTTTPEGFKEAYEQFVKNGWNSVPFSTEIGGQGLPWLVSTAISEMWSGANFAFALCPLLTQGGVELLENHGSADQREKYLRKLVSGEWTATMCLTESTAGSDIGAVKTIAKKDGDKYLIKGQKIFITFGDHDYTDNIIHMVLARCEDAPDGIKGISLFIVPKVLEDGSKNDIRVISIEHKLGIHGSPTAVLNFGDENGAVGYLVGEENHGIKYMFTMMNNARLAVGVEGVAIAEDSLQKAENFAAERVQGGLPIAKYPDVKRMLITIRSQTEAMRALSYYIGKCIDLSRNHEDEAVKEKYKEITDILIPVLKANATDMGFFMSSEAMQVFGGVGYVEDYGIAQNLRDSRIAMIYEGTNGIQAMDLVKRKIIINDGRLFESLSVEVFELVQGSVFEDVVKDAIGKLVNATSQIRSMDDKKAEFKAYYYTRLFGVVMGGVMMAMSDKALGDDESGFFKLKRKTIKFYMDFLLPEVNYLHEIVVR